MDRVTEMTETGFLGNMKSSLAGVLVGIFLFGASFFVLYWNDGRIDPSRIAREAVAVDAQAPDPGLEGRLVCATGTLDSEERVGDVEFMVAPNFLACERRVEMYAWEEDEESETEEKWGGGTRTVTTYTYKQEWTEDPENSGEFYESAGHENPSLTLHGETRVVKKAGVGACRIDGDLLKGLEFETWRPNAEALTPAGQALLQTPADFLFLGKGSLATPQVGDLRISFRVLEPGREVSAWGRLRAGGIEPFDYKGRATLHRLTAGSMQSGIAAMHGEHVMLLWILRVAGFLMMWGGLCLMLGPLSALAGVIPVAGRLTGMLIGIVALPVAGVLTAATVIVSKIMHNPVALAAVIAAMLAGLYFYFKRRGNRSLSVNAEMPPKT